MANSPTPNRHLGRRRLLSATLGAAAAAGLPLRWAQAASPLTLYSGQHQQTVALLTARFTKETGIPVRVHSGDGPEIANQIVAEGARSPADVFFTENSPELMLLAEKGLLAPVDPATLAQIPRRFSAADGKWVGVLARQSVLAYNPALIQPHALPASLLELAEPKWKGKIAIAPTDSDFLPLVDALAALQGEATALAWLKGLKRNAALYQDDEGVVAAVNRGAISTGVINSYYWARLRVALGANRTKCRIYYFPPGDIGGLVNVSGAAALKSARRPKEAQRFLAFLVSGPVQVMLGKSDVDFEYPLAPGVAANPLLKPFSELHPPKVSIASLGDDRLAARLLREAGLI
ncbi:MAG: iron ABC transporter substrate-binding protein [Acetobacteraceae bacterium]